MTAEKFLNKWITKPLDYNDIENLMIEFARYHVEQALKEAEIKAQQTCGNSVIMKNSVLNAYPLENIK